MRLDFELHAGCPAGSGAGGRLGCSRSRVSLVSRRPQRGRGGGSGAEGGLRDMRGPEEPLQGPATPCGPVPQCVCLVAVSHACLRCHFQLCSSCRAHPADARLLTRAGTWSIGTGVPRARPQGAPVGGLP